VIDQAYLQDPVVIASSVVGPLIARNVIIARIEKEGLL
jgi:hypothetical protein